MPSAPAKTRIDSWYAGLTEADQWRIYGRSRREPWYELAPWIAEEYGIPQPGRSAIYRWMARMRGAESDHRLAQAVQARAEVGKLAGATAAGDDLIGAYQSLAAELALAGNAKDAVRLTQMAMQIAAQQTTKAELALKRQRLAQQQDAQRLAREKFEAAEARLGAIKDTVQDTTLSEAERLARMKEIFGL